MSGFTVFCTNCSMFICISGTIVLFLFGIFSYTNAEYFVNIAEQIESKGPFKNKKNKLGTEFVIAAGLYLALSIFFIWKTNRKSTSKIEEEEFKRRMDSIRKSASEINSEESMNKYMDGSINADYGSISIPFYPTSKTEEEEDGTNQLKEESPSG